MFVLQHSPLTDCHAKFPLLNPRSNCDTSNAQSEWEYEDLRAKIVQKIADLQKGGKIQYVSVHFRDMDHGFRFGVQEFDQFFPASLLKVPLMISILHVADKDPALLDKQLSFTGSLEMTPNIENGSETIEAGKYYTVRELLRRMIAYSDNSSANLLVQLLARVNGQTVSNSFLDLGVLPVMAGTTDTISIQSYAYLFAVLYASGYLSRDNSQYALNLLTQSTYNDGLVAGVPQGTTVAHKFGFRDIRPGLSQLHDCGIVYHPKTSYVICVMTSGSDIKTEAAGIADVSKIVYDEITSLKF